MADEYHPNDIGTGDFNFDLNQHGFSVIEETPFYPHISPVVFDSGEAEDPDELYDGQVTGISIKFNQGYIYNRVAETQLSRTPNESQIENMEVPHILPLMQETDYFVEVVIDKNNFLIEKATFTGVTGQAWDKKHSAFTETAPYPIDEYTDFPHVLFDQYDTGFDFFTGYYPVLRISNTELTQYHLRDDIVLSDRQFMQVGTSTSGDAGSAHVLVHSGSRDENLPVRVRAVKGEGSVTVFENLDHILISGSESTGDSGDWSGKNIGDYGVGVYNEFTLNPAEFHKLRGTDNITVALNGDIIDIGADYDNCTNTADWLAYKTINGDDEAEFRGLNAGTGIKFTKDVDHATNYCVTTISTDLQNCSPAGDWAAYKGTNGDKEEFRGLTFGDGIKIIGDATACAPTIQTDIANCTPSPDDADWEAFKGYNAGVAEFRGLKWGVGIGTTATTDDCRTTIRTQLENCASVGADWWAYKGSTATHEQFRGLVAGEGITIAGGDNCIGTISRECCTGTETYAVQSLTNINNNDTKLEFPTSDTSTTKLISNGNEVVLVDLNQLKVQGGTDPTKGQIQLGNVSTQTVKVEQEDGYPSLKLGAGIKRLDAEWVDEGGSDVFKAFEKSSVSIANKNSHIRGDSSPATGSAILGGSGNAISGNYNVIVGGATNKISGLNMNFIGGGSGIDITRSEFSVSVGGQNNDITGSNWSVLGGGYDNLITGGNVNTVGGGYSNELRNVFASVIAGGHDNLISGSMDSSIAIAGGVNNEIINSTYAFIGAGGTNVIQADSDGGVIVGGFSNILKGANSFIGGGQRNVVSGTYGVALGSFAKVQQGHNGAFVFSDANLLSNFSSGANTMVMGFRSGVYIQTDSGLYVNGNPVLTGETPEGDTLQTVTARGNLTTTDILSEGEISGASGEFGGQVSVLGKLAVGTIYSSYNATIDGTLQIKDIDGGSYDGLLFTSNVGGEGRIAATNTDHGTKHPLQLKGEYIRFLAQTGTAVEAMRIVQGGDGSGSVGIGTSDPDSKLHIYAANPNIFLEESDATSTFNITDFQLAGGALNINTRQSNGAFVSTDYQIAKNANGATDHKFFITGSEKVRIDSDGYVGIGISSPDTKLHLEDGRLTIKGNGSEAIKVTNSDIVNFDLSTVRADLFRASAVSDQLEFRGGSNRTRFLNSDGGTELFTITNSGKVGIGTTDPAYILDIHTASNDEGIRLYTTPNTRPAAELLVDSATNGNADFKLYHGTAINTRITSNAGNHTYFNAGNVGIGTNTPAYKLDVDGTIHGTSGNFENGITVNGNPVLTGTSAYETDTLQTVTDDGNTTTNSVHITNAGFGGDYAPLTVSGGYGGGTAPLAFFRGTGTTAYIQCQNSTTSYGSASHHGLTVGNNGNDAYVMQREAAPLYLGTSGEARITIAADGKVGIGSLSPAYPLEVVSVGGDAVKFSRSAAGTFKLRLDAAGGGDTQLQFQNGGTDKFTIGSDNTDGSFRIAEGGSLGTDDRLTIDADGLVGIGTNNPSNKLHVVGTTRPMLIESDNSTNIVKLGNSEVGVSTYNGMDLLVNSSAASSINAYGMPLTFGTSTGNGVDVTERVRIGTGGSVGIGSTTPSEKLDVNGSIILRGSTNHRYKVANDSNNNWAEIGNDGASSQNTLEFFTKSSSVPAMSITNDDGVGIGTTTPYAYDTTGTKLHVKNTGSGISEVARFEGSSDADGAGAIVRIGTSNDRGVYLEGGRTGDVPYASIGTTEYNGAKTEAIHIDSAGRVGIGTNIPSGLNSAVNRLVIGDGAGQEGMTIYTDTSSQGAIYFADGTVGNQAYAGYVAYRHANDRLDFGAGGGTRMVVNGNGVGIGTYTVTSKLEVTGALSDSLAKFKDGPDGVEIATRGTSRQQIDFLGSNTSTINAKGSLFINYDTDNNGSNDTITFARNGEDAAGTADMVITEGKVGVGITNPSHIFHVQAESDGDWVARIDNSEATAGRNYGLKVNAGSSSADIGFEVANYNGDIGLRVQGNSHVGIGTTSADAFLNIYNTGTTSSSADVHIVGSGNTYGLLYERLRNDSLIVSKSTTAGSYFKTDSATVSFQGYEIGTNWFLGQYGYNDFRITDGTKSGGTAALTIQDATQNVGIGVTNPTNKLEIWGQDIKLRASTVDARLTLSASDSVVNNSILNFGDNDSSAIGQIKYAHSGDSMRFQTNSSEAMRIDSSGYVGIGTSSPSYELDVNGTTRSTYYIGGAYLEENVSSSKLKFYTDGTVLVMDEDGSLKPCEEENDTLVFGVSKKDFDQPVVLGAEPVLVTGPIKVGDYIVTSSKQGHGQAMKEEKLGTIIAQAMGDGDGESYNIKAMVRKM